MPRLTAFVLALILLVPAASARAESPLRLGWIAWPDGVFVTELAARLLREELDQPVELVRAGIAEQYQALAAGRIDAMLMSWQPRTHAPYLARVGHRVEDLGVIYDGARLGWAVPAYVPAERIRSMEDLADPETRERLGGRIVGIEPDAGLSRLSRAALRRYDLDGYALQSGDGPAMVSALADAIAAGEWVVVTGWSPHWMFAAHDLRYLADPAGTLGGSEQVHVLARQGLYAEKPRAAAFLARMWIPLDELESALLDAEQRSVDGAVERYIRAQPARIRYWLAGDHADDATGTPD